MVVYDPLYGRFTLPIWIGALMEAPEVRRLSQIRLLNTLSPSLATLGELRRYSHTVGVVHLALESPVPARFTPAEVRALLACIVIHDVGTPPFAHLFEYHLAERHGWHHEAILADVLGARHAPENRAHQIFAGRTTGLESALRRSGVELELVEAILGARHPLARLLFGTLDLDNLDNVLRMAWALGLRGDWTLAERLARGLSVNGTGDLLLRRTAAPLVEAWAALRRAVYEILVFDAPTVAAQAVLSEALGLALGQGILHTDDWTLTDELLLERLRGESLTKRLISTEYLGRLPNHLFSAQVALREHAKWSRRVLKERTEAALVKMGGVARPLAYVFVDNGAFAKEVAFVDTEDAVDWSVGERSQSVIVYGFCRGRTRGLERRKGAWGAVLRALEDVIDDVVRIDFGAGRDCANAQQTLEFSSSGD